MKQATILSRTANAYADGSRYIVNEGGARSGKTFAILQVLITIASKQKQLISVVSETMPHLRKGSVRDFKQLMTASNIWEDAKWNKTESTYNFASGSVMEFFSADTPSKVHGPQRDILFINEGQNIPYEIVRHLFIRTARVNFIDFNPTHEFWAHTELKDDPKTTWIHSTYKDNLFLNSNQRDEIEKNKQNANWWRVYGLGLIGQYEGLVYPEFTLIDEMPQGRVYYGLDFGYNSPSCLVAMVETDEGRYFDEIIYEAGMKANNPQDPTKDFNLRFQAAGMSRSSMIFSDHDPRMISDLELQGWNIVKVPNKDIESGINLMQGKPIFITKRSLNIIKEKRNYRYATKKDGTNDTKPVKLFDHAMDSERYVAMGKNELEKEYKPYYKENKNIF